MIMDSNLDNSIAVDNILEFLSTEEKNNLMHHCYYSIRDNKNHRYFKDTIRNVPDKEFDSLFPLVSVVILTANKIECDSLNYIVFTKEKNDIRKRKHALNIFDNGDLVAPDAYIFKICSSFILHINAYDTGSNTPGGSADLVRFITREQLLRPSCIISFGICYGRDPEKQNIGDVLIPRKLYPWSVAQKITESGFKIKHDDLNLWLEEKFSGSGIYSILRDFCNGEDGTGINDRICLKDSDQKETVYEFMINVMWGNMSTGEAVVSSGQVKALIQDANKNEKEIGGEMEGYGIAKECVYYANIPCFIIKAICDWGEFKDIDQALDQLNISHTDHLKDQLQAYAAFCAGIALIRLFHDESEKFLSLELIRWMTENGPSRYRINKYIGTKKDKFIKSINAYFNTNEEVAESIFMQMVRLNMINPWLNEEDKFFIGSEG